MKLFRYLIIAFIVTVSFSEPIEKVKLQLQWKHQFEFAGFYAAKEKGFYKEAGLDVELIEYNSDINIIDRVLLNKNMYGITYSNLISDYLKGKPLVFIANFFKQSPLAIVAQKDIKLPSDLRDKVVMGVSKQINSAMFWVMFKRFGMSRDDFISVPPTFKIDDFIQNKVDAMTVYTTNETFFLDEMGVEYNLLDPTVYGAEFYDINLFTSQDELKNNPDRVKRFKEASIKGWEYALSHQDEIISLILKKYNSQNKSKESLEYEAEQIYNIMVPNIHSIGSISPLRVNMMVDNFKELGLVKKDIKFDYENFVYKEPVSVDLTKEEKKFIQSHPKIVLASADYEPFLIKNDDGTMSGYNMELLNLIKKKTGLNIEVQIDNWKQIQDRNIKREFDGICSTGYKNIRKKHYNRSDSYLTFSPFVITKKGNPKQIYSIDDLDGKKVVLERGNYLFEEIVKEIKKDIEIIYTDTMPELLRKVASGEADFTVMDESIFYLSKKDGLNSMIEAPFTIGEPFDVMFWLRDDKPQLTSIINKGLRSISTKEKLGLREKWFGDLSSNLKKINLTKDEKEYLKEKKTVKMCVDPNWYPYERIENGHLKGLSSDYIKLFEERIGIKIELVPTKLWSESLEFIKERKCDILPMAMKSKSREYDLNFTKPYLNATVVLAGRIEEPFVANIKNLLNKKLGIVKGYAYHDILKRDYPNINLVEVSSLDDGLKKVQRKELYAMIDSLLVIGNYVQNDYYGSLKIISKLEYNWDLRVAVRSDHPLLLSIFKKAVNTLDQDDHNGVKNRYITVNFQKDELDYELIVTVFLIFVVIVIVLLLNQIVLRKKINEAIKQNNEQSEIIFHQTKLASLGELISIIAHQWRQPLAQLGFINIYMKEKNKDKELQKKIEDMENIITFMSDTLENFQNFYKKDKMDTYFSVSHSIDMAINILETNIKNNKIVISKNIDKQLRLFGQCNSFSQVLIAILQNMVNIFALREVKEPKIKISLIKIERYLLLSIEDNGGGIRMEPREAIFESFVSGKGEKSTGIGLYMARKIIQDKFNGEIDVENTKLGARFNIRLYI